MYEKDYYQIFIAAHICINSTPSICQIYAGQGKTIIMLLCALYFIKEKSFDSVTFVTSSEIL